jgi:hypothetical protein
VLVYHQSAKPLVLLFSKLSNKGFMLFTIHFGATHSHLCTTHATSFVQPDQVNHQLANQGHAFDLESSLCLAIAWFIVLISSQYSCFND